MKAFLRAAASSLVVLMLVGSGCRNEVAAPDSGTEGEDAGTGGGGGGAVGGGAGGGGGAVVDAGSVSELAADSAHPFTAMTHDSSRVYLARTGSDGGVEIASMDLAGGALTPLHDPQCSAVTGMLYAEGNLFFVTVFPNQLRRLPLDGGSEEVLAGYTRSYPQLVASGDSVFLVGVGSNTISVDRVLISADAGSGFIATSSLQNGLTTIAGFGVSGAQEVYGMVGDPNVYVAPTTGKLVSANAIGSDAGELTGLAVLGGDAFVARTYGPAPQLGRIQKVPLDGTTPATTLAELSYGTRYVLADSQHLFWTEYDGTERIYRANLDGTDKTPIGVLTTSTYLYDQTPTELLLITRESFGGKLFAVQK